MPKLGPDGSFMEGGPINAEDQGGLFVEFGVLKNKRLAVMQFHTTVKWVAIPFKDVKAYVDLLRNSIHKTFGEMPYDKSTLPIRVIRNTKRDVIELHFPQPVGILAANLELWLALAEVMEDVLK